MTRKAHSPITPERLSELRAMPYPEYLHTPEWTRRRAVQLMLADHRCQLCNGTEGGLNVHHRSYECIGQEKRADLIVLCRSCHEVFHQHRRLAKPRMAG